MCPIYKLIFQLIDWLTVVIMWNIEKLMKIYLFKVKHLTLLTYQKLVGRRQQGHFTTIWWVIWPWEGYEGISNRECRILTMDISSYPDTCSVWYTFISFLYQLYNMWVIWLGEGYKDISLVLALFDIPSYPSYIHFTICWVIWPWEGYEGISNRASRIWTMDIPSYPDTCSVWYTFISFLYPLYNMGIWLWEGYEDWRYIKQSKCQDLYVWLLLNK